MFCPQCGQERTSHATSFCSRCGFLLTGVSDLLQTGGIRTIEEGGSPRSRGIRMGIFMLLLTVVIAPIMGILSVFLFRAAPWPMGVTMFLIGGAGLLRIAYAVMFESNTKKTSLRESKTSDLIEELPIEGNPNVAGSLPPQRETTASTYSRPAAGIWLDTNELEPASVTENTTKLLEKDR